MSQLNKQAYAVEPDKLIYDGTNPIDATAVQVAIASNTEGVIKRGQVLDSDAGEFSVHAQDGDASVIVAEDTSYAADDTAIVVPVYMSGTFRASEVIADPELTVADVEALREKGIYLK